MKILDGKELAGYITERQARQVRALRQAWHIFPKLAIIKNPGNPVIDTYVRLKESYGDDILIHVDVYNLDDKAMIDKIGQLNDDESVHGIIVQLPLSNPTLTDEIVNSINPSKDVDGLGNKAVWTPATAMAIDWLLAGYNIELRDRHVVIVGNGRLVGRPLSKLWAGAGYDVTVCDDTTHELVNEVKRANVLVSAAGVPGLITTQMVQTSAVVIDAGTTSENGKLVGDVAESVRERDDLTITPVKGGVGPLTVAALFDNVIRAAQATQAKTS